MADLPDLTRLRDDVAERAVEQPFEEVLRRARVHRLRRRASLGAAALVVVGAALLLAPDSGPTTAPPVDRPTPTPTATADGRPRSDRLPASAGGIVAEGRLRSYAVGDEGLVLSVWQACTPDSARCRSAWQLGDDTGTLALVAIGRGTAEAVRAGDGFVVTSPRGPRAVHPDGSAAPVEIGDPPLPVTAGDVAVPRRLGWLVVDPVTEKGWSLLPPPGHDRLAAAVVADDGTVWAMPVDPTAGSVDIWWRQGSRWRSHRIAQGGTPMHAPGPLAVAGDRVAAVASSDGATVIPVGVLAVTTDAGDTWTDVPGEQLPFRFLDSMAATTGGTLFAAEPDGRLWRSTDASWTRFTPVHAPGPVVGLQAAGASVAGLTGGDEPSLVLLGDDGTATTVSLR